MNSSSPFEQQSILNYLYSFVCFEEFINNSYKHFISFQHSKESFQIIKDKFNENNSKNEILFLVDNSLIQNTGEQAKFKKLEKIKQSFGKEIKESNLGSIIISNNLKERLEKIYQIINDNIEFSQILVNNINEFMHNTNNLFYSIIKMLIHNYFDEFNNFKNETMQETIKEKTMMENKMEYMKSMIEKYDKEISCLKKRLYEISIENSELKNTTKEAKKNSELVNTRIEQAKKQSEEAIKKANLKYEEAIRKCEEANKKSEEANKKSDEANKKSEEAKKRIEEANLKCEEANKKSEEANKKSEEANKKSEDADKKMIEAILRMKEAEIKISVTNKKIMETNNAANEKIQEVVQLKSESEKRFNELNNKYKSLLEINLKNLKKEKQIQNKFKNYEEKIRKIFEQNKELNIEITQLKVESERKNSEIESLNNYIKTVSLEIPLIGVPKKNNKK